MRYYVYSESDGILYFILNQSTIDVIRTINDTQIIDTFNLYLGYDDNGVRNVNTIYVWEKNGYYKGEITIPNGYVSVKLGETVEDVLRNIVYDLFTE